MNTYIIRITMNFNKLVKYKNQSRSKLMYYVLGVWSDGKKFLGISMEVFILQEKVIPKWTNVDLKLV